MASPLNLNAPEQELNPPQAAPTPPAVQPVVPAANDDQITNDFKASRAQAAQGDPWKSLDTLLTPAAQSEGAAPVLPEPKISIGRRILNGTVAAVKDIGKGLNPLGMEPEKALLGGVLDYGNNLVKFADTVVKTAEKHGLPNVYFRLFDKEGKWSPAMMSTAEFRAAQAAGKDDIFQLPTTGKQETVTGDVIRMGTSFLVGRGNIAEKGAGVLPNAVADLVSGMTSMNPAQPRLSNVIDSVAPNFITNWLKAKPEEEQGLLDHLKSGMEMAGLGMAVTGIVKAVKAAKNAISSGSAPAALEAPAEGAAASEAGTAAKVAETPGPTVAQAGGVSQAIKEDLLEAAFKAEGPITATKGAEVKMPPPEGMNAEYAALQKLGYPEPSTGNVLAPPAKEVPTVVVSPGLKANFEKFMAQERGEIATPAEVVPGKPLGSLRSADFSSTGNNPVRVNLNMINGPEDLKDAVARVSSEIPANAVQHNDAVVEAAHSLGMTGEEFLAGPGGALKNTEVVGLRMVVNDASSQFLNLAKTAVADGTPESKAQALAAYAKVSNMLTYLQSAKAESGRSVQAWGIPVAGSRIPYSQAVQRIAEITGGPEGETFLARMAELDSPAAVNSAVHAAGSMSGKEWFMYGWYNSLLTPRTVAKKAMSDVLMAGWNIATRYGAEKFGPEQGVQAGETAALLQGYTGSFKEALGVARRGLMAGRSQFMSEVGTLDAFDRIGALADAGPETLAMEAPTHGWISYLRAALPTSWIGSFDDFAKTVNYFAEKNSLAYRSAASKGLTGADLEDAVRSLNANPPMWLHRGAVDGTLRNTFQDPLVGLAGSIRTVADDMSIPLGHGSNFELPVGRILMPFVKVPVNIARWSYNNSPIPLIMPSSRIAAELAAGGATRDLALTRIAMGSTLSLTFAGLALNGTINGKGPSDPELARAWKAAGHEQHSVVLNGKPYGFNQVEPMGMMAGIIADTYDIMRFAKEEDAGQAGLSLVFGTGQALMSKTYLSGVADFFHAMESPDKQSGPYVDRLLASMVPLSNTANLFRNGMDPWMRAHRDLLTTIENRLPYLSEGLPPQRTLWGDAIPVKDGYMPFLTGTGFARAMSPVPVGKPAEDAQPIDKWIWDNRMAFPRGPDNKLGITRPGVIQSFSAGPHVSAQVELTPKQHDRFQVLAGNELKDPSSGQGARDTLNGLVSGTAPNAALQKQWDNANPAVKALIVQTVINKFRSAAKQQLLNEFPDVREAANAGWQSRGQQLQAPGAQ